MRIQTITEIPKIAVKVLIQAIKSPWTTLYPREKRILPINARGRHLHLGGPEGTCIGCSRCARACPNVAITVHRKSPKEDSYIVINYSRCIYCGYCVDVCPTSSIFHLPDYNLSVERFEDLKMDAKALAKVDPEILERLQRQKAELPEGFQEVLDKGLAVPSDREKVKWRSKDEFAI